MNDQRHLLCSDEWIALWNKLSEEDRRWAIDFYSKMQKKVDDSILLKIRESEKCPNS